MTDNSPFLDYETETVDGVEQAIWSHDGETLVGNELGTADDPDAWSMRWYCPRCGERNIDESELEPAGMTDIHLPCATESEKAAAKREEARVAHNIQNSNAFEEGAYDGVRNR